MLPENQNSPVHQGHRKAAVDKNKVAWKTAGEWK